MKNPIIILLFFITLSLNSLTDWNLSLSAAISGNAFLDSTDIYEHTYFLPKNITNFKLTYSNDNVLIALSLKDRNEAVNNILVVDTLLALFRKKDNFGMGIFKGNLGYGKNSYIYNSFVNSIYYDRYLSDEYMFNGLSFRKFFKKWDLVLNLGENDLNKEIFNFSINYKNKASNHLGLYYFWVVRDNLYNAKKNSLNLEVVQTFGKLDMKILEQTGFYPALYKKRNILKTGFFAEVIYRFNSRNIIGTNYLYNQFYKNDKRFNFYIENKYQKFIIKTNLQYYLNRDNLADKKVGLELDRTIEKILKLGAFFYYGNSFNNRNYLQFGLLMTFNYGKK